MTGPAATPASSTLLKGDTKVSEGRDRTQAENESDGNSRPDSASASAKASAPIVSTGVAVLDSQGTTTCPKSFHEEATSEGELACPEKAETEHLSRNCKGQSEANDSLKTSAKLHESGLDVGSAELKTRGTENYAVVCDDEHVSPEKIETEVILELARGATKSIETAPESKSDSSLSILPVGEAQHQGPFIEMPAPKIHTEANNNNNNVSEFVTPTPNEKGHSANIHDGTNQNTTERLPDQNQTPIDEFMSISKGSKNIEPPPVAPKMKLPRHKNPRALKPLKQNQWEGMYHRLLEYKKVNGHCCVPKRYSADPKLGTWVETQRVQFRKLWKNAVGKNAESESLLRRTVNPTVMVQPSNRLNTERLQILQDAGFNWFIRKSKIIATNEPQREVCLEDEGGDEVDKKQVNNVTWHDTHWNEMYEKLELYKEEHGDCIIQKGVDKYRKLATWVETQRVLYQRYYVKPTDNEECTLINCIGDQVSTSQDHLNARVAQSNDIRIDATNCDTNSKLQQQEICTTETLPNHTASVKEQEEKDMIMAAAEIGLNILSSGIGGGDTNSALTSNDSNNEMVDNFSSAPIANHLQNENIENVSTVAAKGIIEARSIESDNNKTKGALIDKSSLTFTESEASKLESTSKLGATMDNQNPSVSTALKELIKKPVDCEKPVAAQRKVNPTVEKPRLTEERKEKLDKMGFVWSLRSKRAEEHWEYMFAELMAYKEEFGHCMVPSRFEKNLRLGKWVEFQRYEYTKLSRAKEACLKGNIDAEQLHSKSLGIRLTGERIQRLEEIGFEWKVKHKMRRYYDKQWNEMFERMLQYKEKFGDCNVPKRYLPDLALGSWVHTQRVQNRKMGMCLEDKEVSAAGSGEDTNKENTVTLSQDRKRRLEAVSFAWSAREIKKNKTDDSESNASNSALSRTKRAESESKVKSYEVQWNEMLEKLKEYKEREGDTLVPKRYKDKQLGTWVDTQRVQYKKLQKRLAESNKVTSTRLTEERIRRLEEIGFVWSCRDDWQKHYEELIEYKLQFGDCNVPARYSRNRRLGIWVSAQRQNYKRNKRSKSLTPERITLLNELGFSWTIRSRDSLGESWNQRLEQLKEYKKAHGNCQVPSRFPENPELGVWCGTQRTQYRFYIKTKEKGNDLNESTSQSCMTEERILKLEELGFVWTLRSNPEGVWRKRIEELRKFKIKNGNRPHPFSAVPAYYKENPRLGAWAANLRAQMVLVKKNELSTLNQEKINELNSLGFCWAFDDVAQERTLDSGPFQQEVDLTERPTELYAQNLNMIQDEVVIAADASIHHGAIPMYHAVTRAPPHMEVSYTVTGESSTNEGTISHEHMETSDVNINTNNPQNGDTHVIDNSFQMPTTQDPTVPLPVLNIKANSQSVQEEPITTDPMTLIAMAGVEPTGIAYNVTLTTTTTTTNGGAISMAADIAAAAAAASTVDGVDLGQVSTCHPEDSIVAVDVDLEGHPFESNEKTNLDSRDGDGSNVEEPLNCSEQMYQNAWSRNV